MVNAFLLMMNTPKGFLGPLNAGNPNEVTIRELAERIVDLTGSSSKLVFKKLPEDDPRRRKPDITLAQDKLSWESVVNLESGLLNTINYFKNIIN